MIILEGRLNWLSSAGISVMLFLGLLPGVGLGMPVVQTPLEIEVPGEPERRSLSLAIADVVQLVVENNTAIKNAYLDRLAQRQSLAVAEDKFNPDLTPRVVIDLRRDENGIIINSSEGVDLGAQVRTTLPLGSEINLNWRTLRRFEREFGSREEFNRRRLDHQVQLQVKQPLLRGAGVRVNRASVEGARLSDRINQLDLKAILINQVTQAILLYRQLFQRQEELKIAQLTLENSRRLLEVTEALIEAGKRAPVQRIQGQADVAAQELRVLEAENALDRARLELLNLLELDRELLIVAEPPTAEEPPILEYQPLLAVAISHNPGYLKAQLSQKVAGYQLIEAADQRRWSLDWETQYNWLPSNLIQTRSNFQTGLTLSQVLGDLTREQGFQQSQVNLSKAENTVNLEYAKLGIDLSDRLRDIQLTLEQVNQSETARVLAQQQLETEQTKLSLGIQGTSLTEIIRFQNDLALARQRELTALINYLNALTSLDQLLGVTLERWNLPLEIK